MGCDGKRARAQVKHQYNPPSPQSGRRSLTESARAIIPRGPTEPSRERRRGVAAPDLMPPKGL
jgi:hypothetical protein